MQLEEIKQDALYLQQQGNLPATHHQPLGQKYLSDYLPTLALSVDVGTPLVEAWEMALHSEGGLQSGLPTREEPGVKPDVSANGAVDSSSSRPTPMERTDNNKSLKKERRTSILSAFLFASKTAKGLSTDDQDKSLENRSQPETPRKLLGRLRLPRQHSMPQPIFRRAIWNDGLDPDEPKSYEKDGSGVPKDPGHEKSAACSSELAISSDFLESGDSLFTEASVIRTASTCTAPFSAVPSSGPDSIDTGPLLSTPLDNVASMSNSSSSNSPKRPQIQRTQTFRQEGRTKLFKRLNPEEQIALEHFIHAEVARRCRQVLIEIENDMVFEKAMSKAMRDQFRSQTQAREKMANSCEEGQERTELSKSAIRRSFLVREILRGERSYMKHLEHGVMLARERDAPSTVSNPMKLDSSRSPIAMQHSLSDNVVELSRRKQLGRQASVDFRPASAKISSSRSLQRLSLFDDGSIKSAPHIKQAFAADTSETLTTDSDALVIYHFQKLIEVSRQFVIAMEYDPDPYSITMAFCDSNRQMKDVYGDWAGVVGDLIHRTFWPVEDAKFTHSLSQPGRRRMLSMTAYSSPKKTTPSTTADAPRLHLPDIIIMPTQRVARYAMLFKDVLHNVPENTVTLEAVHMALQMAQSLAILCNDRQKVTDAFSTPSAASCIIAKKL